MFYKIAALDIGDVWTGVAISDRDLIIGAPDTTVMTEQLFSFLKEYIIKNDLKSIVVGLPITMRGGESAQTTKTREMMRSLQTAFPHISFISVDERLTSTLASGVKRQKKRSVRESKEGKQREHAIAAAFILNSYLEIERSV